MKKINTTRVNLRNLMEVLGNHLYSTPAVAVRELIQNAHDSCIRRQIEDSETFEPEIQVTTSESKKLLIIEDNGSGLTEEEIHEYLATVGSGYTKELREQTANEEMIGAFGLGFLTAYVVSDSVELWTTSYRERDRGWYFQSNGIERYAVEETEPRTPGTRVVLHLSEEFHDLARDELARRVLRRYCALFPVPVSLNSNVRINDIIPPWKREKASSVRMVKENLEFVSLFENRFEPLCAFGVEPNDAANVRGILWIQDSATYGTSDNRRAYVFVRGMLVSEDERDLLPAWAGFVGGVFESSEMQPTASRETLQKNDAYEAAKSCITEALIGGLGQIARKNPGLWRSVLLRHNEALLGASICDERLFKMLEKDLKLPTSEGELTMPEIVKRGDGKIYVSLDEAGGPETVIFRALMKPIVYGYRYGVLPFCLLYGKKHGPSVIQLGTESGNAGLFAPVQDANEGEEELLAALLAGPNQKLVLTRFEPEYLPLVLIPNRELEIKRRLEADEADRRIASGVLSLARMYTAKIKDETESAIYVNMSSPVVHRLLAMPGGETRANLAKLLASFVYISSSGRDADGERGDCLRLFWESVSALMR